MLGVALVSVAALTGLTRLLPSRAGDTVDRGAAPADREESGAFQTVAPPDEVTPTASGSRVLAPFAEETATGSVSGVLLTPDGEPTHGTIVLHRRTSDGRSSKTRAQASKDGRFHFAPDEVEGAIALSTPPRGAFGGAVLGPIPHPADALELRHVPARSVRLDARDPEGAPVEQPTVTAYLELPEGVLWKVDRRERTPGVFALPAGRFQLHVHAHDYPRATFGPFEPKQVGATVRVTLEPFPRIHGRVLRKGAPIAGAQVTADVSLRGMPGSIDLEARAPGPAGNYMDRTTTDAAGRFDVRLTRTVELVFRARVEGGLEGIAGPLKFDMADEPPEVVIELDREPGRIKGRLIVPPGTRHDDHFLVARGPNDSHFIERISTAGTFDWRELAMGIWCVDVYTSAVLESETAPGQRVTIHSGDEWGMLSRPTWGTTDELLFPVIVRANETQEVLFDASSKANSRLRGRIFVATATHSSRRPMGQMQAFANAESRRALSTGGRLGKEGTFEITSRVQGRFLLRGTLSVDGGRIEVRDEIELSAHARPWELALNLGQLRVRLPEEDSPYRIQHLHRAASGARVYSEAKRSEAGDYLFPAVHAGQGELFVDRLGVRRVLARCEVSAGTETVVDARD